MAKGDKDNRRCSYKDCKKPEGCRQYFQIEAGRNSGGQNWNALAGFTLCPTCYQQYKSRGTLERKKPLPESAKKCSYELCDGSNQGKQFYEISENSNAGGKDWKPLKGRVLCHTCYCRCARTRTRKAEHAAGKNSKFIPAHCTSSTNA